MSIHHSHPSAYDLIKTLLSEKCEDAQREVVFQDLVQRPITADLLVEGVQALRESMIPTLLSSDAIDTCGTGGSGKKTINTSTLAALIVATAGGKIAKHGNRSASGNCGCFDLLEQLGICINLTPEMEQHIFDELGLVFFFAPSHHPSLKRIAPLRKKYGKKTVFNLIGPLCNPAGVNKQLIGTGNEQDAILMTEALFQLGSFGSKVVTGKDGLDEVTVIADTTVYSVTSSGIEKSLFSPVEISVPYAEASEIEGGSVKENADVFLKLIQGFGDPAKKNLILVNSAHALVLAGISTSLQEGYERAKETLESGKVHNLFQEYRELTSS